MSVINDIFDIVFVINLANDKFKKKMMIKKLNKLNIKHTFVEAINGYQEPILSQYNIYKNKPCDWDGSHEYEIARSKKMIPSAGAYGYLESWLKILDISTKFNYKKILVFDDDVIFDNNFEEKVKDFFDIIPTDFKIAALGLSQHNWGKIVYKDKYYNPIVYTDGSFALGIDSSVFPELIQQTKLYNIAFDSGPIRYIYNKYKSECFIAYPNLVIADVSTSSIGGSRNMIETSSKLKWPLQNFNYIQYSNVKVSVIIPVYNASKTIELSIKSILNQTYNNIEVIIIDDASTDNSLSIINNLITNNENVKVIELKKNMGCYFAKNIGIRISTGSLICFQDADDISVNNRIEKQAKEIIENDYSIVGTNIIRCTKNILDEYNLDNVIKYELSNQIKPRLGLITLMFKKQIFIQNGYFNDYYHHSMDQEFIDRIYFNNNNKLSETHCHELLNNGSFKNYKKLDEILYICQPLDDNNISCKYNRGHKNHIRLKYLKNIENKEPLKYIISFKLIDLVINKFGNIIINDADELYYLKYFTNDSTNILEINPIENTINPILLTNPKYITENKSNKYIITTNGDIKNEIDHAQYIKINDSYAEYIKRLENEQILFEKIKLESYNLKKKQMIEKMELMTKLKIKEKENNIKLETRRLENDIIKNKLNKNKILKTTNLKIKLEQERIKLEQKEKERIKLEQEEQERIKLEQDEKERIKLEQEEKERIKLEQDEKERIKLEQEEKERIKLEQEEKERIKLEQEEKERSLLHNFIINNKIEQIVISSSLPGNNHFSVYASPIYKSNNINTLFYGIYTLDDMAKVKKHTGKKWILWAGNDCNTTNNKRIQILFNCLKYNVEQFLSISHIVNKHLSNIKIDFLYLNESTREIEDNIYNNKKIDFNTKIELNENIIFKDIPIYILNLKRREDRLNFMKFKLNDIGIYKYNIFEAIDGQNSKDVNNLYSNYNNTITETDYLKNKKLYITQKSVFAILLSYKILIKSILDKQYDHNKYIMILEDDVSFSTNIENYKLDIGDDVIYLGGNQLSWCEDVKTNYSLINNEKYITYGAYGILYKVSFLDKFYNSVLIHELRKPYDYLLWKFIVSNNINNKVIYPNLILPNLDDSDNMGKRDIFKICQLKKWDLNLYKYQLLELEFYTFYKQAHKFKSLRMIDKYIDSISYKDISRIIEGNNRTFVFIIASYNNKYYYKKNLDSILNQTYKLWRVIYTDDCSTDDTYDLVNNYIIDNNLENNFILLKNDINMKQAYSRYQSYKRCDDDEIICFLDGDDWLYDNNVLEKLNNEYQSDIKLTYGSYYKYENNKITTFVKSKVYENNVILHNLYRQMKGWYGIPLRTGYASLYKSMPESYMLDNKGNWMSACTDVAEFLWGIEHSEGKFKNIDYPTYVYNIDASKRFKNSMYNLNKKELQYRINTSEKIFNYNM